MLHAPHNPRIITNIFFKKCYLTEIIQSAITLPPLTADVKNIDYVTTITSVKGWDIQYNIRR